MGRHRRRFGDWLLVPLEWLGLLLAMAVIPLLTRRMLFACCDGLSALMFRFDRRGKRRALENLHIVRNRCVGKEGTIFYDPDRAEFRPTPAELKILRRSYRNMARTVGYAFWTVRNAKERCAATGEMCAAGREFLAANRPAITVSGHIGSWEILSQLAFLEGHRMMSVAKNIGTPGMTRLLMRVRKAIGQEIIPAEGALKPLLQGIRDGKSLGLLVDQSVSPKRGGVWIRFLGRPMSVSAAPGLFAAKTGRPIVVAWSRPLRDGRYRCEVVDTIFPEAARDLWATTQRCARDLERVVRRHPSCWVLNYNFFSNWPMPEDLKALRRREERAR